MHHKDDLIKDLEMLYSAKPVPVREAFRIQKELSQRVVQTLTLSLFTRLPAPISLSALRKKSLSAE